MPKGRLRQECIKRRDDLTPLYRQQASEAICRQLLSWRLFQQAEQRLLYMAIKSEVDLQKVVEASLHQGKTVVLPRTDVSARRLDLYPISSTTELVKGPYGILEPLPSNDKVTLDQISIAILPGVAFDKAGYRLGYGGGYYDRLMADCPKQVIKVGIAFIEQVLPSVFPEKHDQKVDWLVTSEGIMQCTENA